MFHAFLGEVYRSFYANLGATMADVGHDSTSSMRTLAAFVGLTVGVTAALILPALGSFLATAGSHRITESPRAFIISCVLPAAPLTLIISYVDNEPVRKFFVFIAVYAAAACMLGLLASGLTAVPALLPPVAFVVALLGFFGVRKIFRELTPLLLLGDAIVLTIVAAAALGVLKLFPPTYGRTALPQLHWPRTSRQQFAIVFIPIGIVAAVGIGRLVYLDAASARAAEQVRTYGYITDRPYELNLNARPVTVRLLTKDDPLHICSPERPVALTQLNQMPGDSLVLMRYLEPGSLSPSSDRSPRTIRLPASQYAVVQHLAGVAPNDPENSKSSDKPSPWTVSACSE